MRSKNRFTPGDFAACVPPACVLLMIPCMALPSEVGDVPVQNLAMLALLLVAFVAIGAVGMGFLLHTVGDLVEWTWSWRFQRRQFARVGACLLGVCLFCWGLPWVNHVFD